MPIGYQLDGVFDKGLKIYVLEKYSKHHKGSLKNSDDLIEHEDNLYKMYRLDAPQNTAYVLSGGMRYRLTESKKAQQQFEKQMLPHKEVKNTVLALKDALQLFGSQMKG